MLVQEQQAGFDSLYCIYQHFLHSLMIHRHISLRLQRSMSRRFRQQCFYHRREENMVYNNGNIINAVLLPFEQSAGFSMENAEGYCPAC